jgi:hypothetical protein
MKKLFKISGNLKTSLAVVAFFLFQSLTWAQDKTVDVNLNIDGGGTEWYAEPWVMVVGIAVFIIIIVGLLRGKK